MERERGKRFVLEYGWKMSCFGDTTDKIDELKFEINCELKGGQWVLKGVWDVKGKGSWRVIVLINVRGRGNWRGEKAEQVGDYHLGASTEPSPTHL